MIGSAKPTVSHVWDLRLKPSTSRHQIPEKPHNGTS